MGTPLTTDPAPFFEAHLFVCTNRRADGHKRGSCAASGSEHLRDYMKARAKELGIPNIRVNTAGLTKAPPCRNAGSKSNSILQVPKAAR
jgi:hypothetical protein